MQDNTNKAGDFCLLPWIHIYLRLLKERSASAMS